MSFFLRSLSRKFLKFLVSFSFNKRLLLFFLFFFWYFFRGRLSIINSLLLSFLWFIHFFFTCSLLHVSFVTGFSKFISIWILITSFSSVQFSLITFPASFLASSLGLNWIRLALTLSERMSIDNTRHLVSFSLSSQNLIRTLSLSMFPSYSFPWWFSCPSRSLLSCPKLSLTATSAPKTRVELNTRVRHVSLAVESD